MLEALKEAMKRGVPHGVAVQDEGQEGSVRRVSKDDGMWKAMPTVRIRQTPMRKVRR